MVAALAIPFNGNDKKRWINLKKIRRLSAIYSWHHTRRDGGWSRTTAQGAASDRWHPVSRPALTGGTVINPLGPGARAAGAPEPRRCGQFDPAWHREQKQSIRVNRASPPTDTRCVLPPSMQKNIVFLPAAACETLYAALRAINARCDGAQERDGEGFAKLDVQPAALLLGSHPSV